MHSKEDEEPKLKPENDESQWRDDFLTDGGSDEAYKIGYGKGWAAAIESLKVLELTDAAERLEALAKMPHA